MRGRNLFWLIIIGLVAIPVGLWLAMQPLNTRFGNPEMTFLSIGQMMGLVGMSLFSINLILSARWKILDEKFEGLGFVYAQHHVIGGMAFIFILLHPMFLTVNYLTNSLTAAYVFWLPSLANPALMAGKISLAMMIVVLGLTFFAKIRYELWKIIHRLMGVAFGFTLIHVGLISSDVSINPLLKGYLLVLGTVGIVSYIYRSILGKTKIVKRLGYKVSQVIKLNENVYEVRLDPLGRTLQYQAGQFVFLKIKDKQIGNEEHPFSLASVSSDKQLSLIVKDLGDYTKRLGLAKTGTVAEIEGPFGKFGLQFHPAKKYIWVAGGIGITPFIGIARQMEERKMTIPVDLYYSESNEKDFVYRKKFAELANKFPTFRFFPQVSKIDGRLTAEIIKRKSGGIADVKIFVCATSGMIQALKKQLLKLGVAESQLVYEEFNLRD